MSPVFKNRFISVLRFLCQSWDSQFCYTHRCQVRFITYSKPSDQCCTAPTDATSGSRLITAACVSFWWRCCYLSSFHSNEAPFRMKDVLCLKPTRIISKINSNVCSERISSGINPLDKRSESLCQLDRDICWFQKVHHGWSAVWRRVYRFSTLTDNNHEY